VTQFLKTKVKSGSFLSSGLPLPLQKREDRQNSTWKEVTSTIETSYSLPAGICGHIPGVAVRFQDGTVSDILESNTVHDWWRWEPQPFIPEELSVSQSGKGWKIYSRMDNICIVFEFILYLYEILIIFRLKYLISNINYCVFFCVGDGLQISWFHHQCIEYYR
jgi:hypothetical protein